MEDLVSRQYEQARHVLRNLMGLIEKNIPWPARDLDKGVAGVFGEVIDDLYRDRAYLLELLRRKEAFRSQQLLREGEWAELEELDAEPCSSSYLKVRE
jgi:hypothetical protein